MAYGKYKMVINPKGAEEARRQQEKQKRNPSKGTKEAPIVKFGSERRAKPMPINIDELRNRGNSPRKPNPEKRPPRRPLNPGGTAEKRPLPKPGKTLIDTIKGEKRPLPKPGTRRSIKLGLEMVRKVVSAPKKRSVVAKPKSGGR